MKQTKAVTLKALGGGKPVSEDQLAKVNKYSLVDLTAEVFNNNLTNVQIVPKPNYNVAPSENIQPLK